MLTLPIEKNATGLFIRLSDAVKSFLLQDTTTKVESLAAQVENLTLLVAQVIDTNAKLKADIANSNAAHTEDLKLKSAHIQASAKRVLEIQAKIDAAAISKVFDMTILQEYKAEQVAILKNLTNGIY